MSDLQESSPLRSASFSLFGELGARVGGSSEQFASHLHNNLVALLLHLNDDSDDVRQVIFIASILTPEIYAGKS